MHHATMSRPTPPITADTPDPKVRELRAASRRLVRALGMVRGSGPVDEVGTPAQCHALVELSLHGRLTTGELAEILEIDKSTASRTLRPLLDAGLVERHEDPRDQRTRPMGLSAAGRERVERVHAAADAQVRGALDLLSADERDTVLRGVSLYERALHRAAALETIVLRPVEARDDPALARIIRTVMTEFGAVGCGFSIEDAEVDAMHAAYTRPRHAYFVVERDGEVLAGGGIAPLAGAEADTCELRKMYALPQARGLGVGRRLLELSLAAAREHGFRTCYLESLRSMHAARALYEKAGFRRIDGPMGATGHHACDDYRVLEL